MDLGLAALGTKMDLGLAAPGTRGHADYNLEQTGGDWETLDEASKVTWDLGVMWTSGLSSWVTGLLAWT